MNMNTGKWIQNKRKENGLSLDDLAKAVGVNRATIYRWESNESTPPASAVSTIAHILNTNPKASEALKILSFSKKTLDTRIVRVIMST